MSDSAAVMASGVAFYKNGYISIINTRKFWAVIIALEFFGAETRLPLALKLFIWYTHKMVSLARWRCSYFLPAVGAHVRTVYPGRTLLLSLINALILFQNIQKSINHPCFQKLSERYTFQKQLGKNMEIILIEVKQHRCHSCRGENTPFQWQNSLIGY